MTASVIRAAAAGDAAAVAALYRAAFEEEDLVALAAAILLGEGGAVSRVAEEGGRVSGHVAVTPCAAGGSAVVLLGPLAVLPGRQGRGTGSALVRAAFDAAAEAGGARVLVLGDPGFYSRFGFAPERDIAPPHALPEGWESAWQGRALAGRTAPRGVLRVPEIWDDPALWSD